VPLVKEAWGQDGRPEVAAYVKMVATIVSNLGQLRPSVQRSRVIGEHARGQETVASGAVANASMDNVVTPTADASTLTEHSILLDLARATAADGRQRGIGAQDPEDLEELRDQAVSQIGGLPSGDDTRFVLPWLWHAGRTGGRALTPEGQEFGYELRFSRYKAVQVIS
jgi:hypothetical protein